MRKSLLKQFLAEDQSFTKAVVAGVFTVPGDNGDNNDDGIDFEPIMQRLVSHDYNGWVVMEAEQDPTKAPPLPYARLGYHALHQHLARVTLPKQEAASASVENLICNP